jgi:hypothetical protein
MSVITTVGKWSCVVLSSLNRIASPGCRLGTSSANVGAAEDPVVDIRMTIVARTVVDVILPPGKSIACDIKGQQQVNGSMIHQLDVQETNDGLKGLPDKAHKCLEFRQACISASNVESSL